MLDQRGQLRLAVVGAALVHVAPFRLDSRPAIFTEVPMRLIWLAVVFAF